MLYSELKNKVALDLYYGSAEGNKMRLLHGTLDSLMPDGEEEYEDSGFADIELENGVGLAHEVGDGLYVLADSAEQAIAAVLDELDFSSKQERDSYERALREAVESGKRYVEFSY